MTDLRAARWLWDLWCQTDNSCSSFQLKVRSATSSSRHSFDYSDNSDMVNNIKTTVFQLLNLIKPIKFDKFKNFVHKIRVNVQQLILFKKV